MATKQDNSNYLLYGGALVLLYVAGNKIFQKLGIVETAADVQASQASAQVDKENYFDPAYYEDRKKVYTIMSLEDKGLSYAKKLYNAKGIFNDNEADVYGVFRALQSKTQVSLIAKAFFGLYGKDLKNYLQPSTGFLNESEWNEVVNIISKLKEGIKVNGVFK
jgi:hypothetical protein